MASIYENVPVFRSGSSFGSSGPGDIIGKAQVEKDEEGVITITIKTIGDNLPEFLSLGELMAFELNSFVNNVDREAAKDYWSRQQ